MRMSPSSRPSRLDLRAADWNGEWSRGLGFVVPLACRLTRPVLVLAAILPVFVGCGSLIAPTEFPNSVVGADGQVILLDELESIANNPDLSDDEKRAEFRALGIEDEDLVDALLSL